MSEETMTEEVTNATEEGEAKSAPRGRGRFTAECAACGAETRLPFAPRPGRAVYCRDCYQPQPREAPQPVAASRSWGRSGESSSSAPAPGNSLSGSRMNSNSGGGWRRRDHHGGGGGARNGWTLQRSANDGPPEPPPPPRRGLGAAGCYD
jgi:CxxC-x17-CxxC domain-containing protein